MRSPVAVAVLVLVAGCSDGSTPAVVVAGPSATAEQAAARSGKPSDGRPSVPGDTATRDTVPVLARLESMLMSSLTRIDIPPDGYSHQADAVHPDVACSVAWWNGARCWVTYTPYAGSDPGWENPSFLTMTDETHWALPAGVMNPVVKYPGVNAYNSDPDQAFDPGTGRLVTFYREVNGAYNNIYAISTSDGRTWSTPQLAFRATNHNAVSPAVIINNDRSARMWYVQSGVGCSAATTSVRVRSAKAAPGQRFEDVVWSPADDVTLVQPGFTVWHMDVIDLPGREGYLAVMADHAVNNDCASDDIWMAISRDGFSWHTFAVPILWRASPESRRLGVRSWYRAAARYDAETDSLHIWPSALMSDGAWAIFHTSVDFSRLVRTLLAATLADQPTAQLQIASRVPAAIRNRMP